jgi:hypothetical protein
LLFSFPRAGLFVVEKVVLKYLAPLATTVVALLVYYLSFVVQVLAGDPERDESLSDLVALEDFPGTMAD